MEGLENIPPGVCIFAANHISNVDPLAFVPAIPRRVSVLLKSELCPIPILSTAMRLAKFVPVDRADKEAAVASVNVALGVLKEGLSLAVYPEGTRSPDGRLKPFKKGTFALAIEAGVPIVPVSISGAQHLMRKGEWTMRPGEIVVRFGAACGCVAIHDGAANGITRARRRTGSGGIARRSEAAARSGSGG